jgi:hypothetical protein
MRSRGVAALLITIAAACAPPAAAWDTPVAITPAGGGTSAQNPQVAMDGQGRAVGIWTRSDTPGNATSWHVEGATRVLGNPAWSPLAAPLSAAGSDSGASVNSETMDLDVGTDGAAAAAWIQGANRELQAATSSAFGSPFGNTTTMTVPSGDGSTCTNNKPLADDHVVGPSVALGPTVRGYVSWMAPCGDTLNGRFELVKEIGATGAFVSGVIKAGRGAGDEGPRLERDPQTGAALVLFHDTASSTPGLTLKEIENANIQPNPTIYSAGNSGSVNPLLSVLPDGQRVVSWLASAAETGLMVQVGSTPAVRVNAADEGAGFYRVGAGADGTIVAVWRVGSDFSLKAAVRNPVTHEWGPPHRISDGDTKQFDVGVSATGVGYAVWNRDTGASGNELEASILDPSDPSRAPGTPYQFQPVPETLVQPAQTTIIGASNGVGDIGWPKLAVAPNGTAQVLFPFVTGLGPPTVTFAIGSIVSPIDRSTAVAPPPAAPAPIGPAGAPATIRDTRAPKITAFSVSRREFGIGRTLDKVLVDRLKRSVARPKRLSALRVGTILRWTQDEAGSARIVIAHKGCFTFTVRGTPEQSLNVCKRGPVDGTVFAKSVKGKRGANSLTYFGLRQGSRPKLRAGGLYKATIVVTDAAGNRSSARVQELAVDASLADG